METGEQACRDYVLFQFRTQAKQESIRSLCLLVHNGHCGAAKYCLIDKSVFSAVQCSAGWLGLCVCVCAWWIEL